jgi:hypothetical protein
VKKALTTVATSKYLSLRSLHEPVVKLSTATWINQMRDGREYLKGSVSQPMKRDEPTVISPVTNDDALPF